MARYRKRRPPFPALPAAVPAVVFLASPNRLASGAAPNRVLQRDTSGTGVKIGPHRRGNHEPSYMYGYLAFQQPCRFVRAASLMTQVCGK